MSQHRVNQEITVVGIDLGKTWVQVCGQDGGGQIQLERKMKPKALRAWLRQLPPCRIGMEACGRSHHWARVLQGYGHEVRLIAPQFVKPFVKASKTDRADAEAICEAVQRPSMRYVGIKTVDQQDQQALHRIRRLAVSQRTAQVNQIRGLLAEYGIEIAQGRHHVRKRLPDILEDGENGLSPGFRGWLCELYEELVHLDARIGQLDRQIERMAHTDEQARRLMGIPGVGPMTATALLAAVGDVKMFRNGRQFAAWLGLVPRQHSTGGKDRLLGISKRGDRYVRGLLIHGARSVVRRADKKPEDTRRQWLGRLLERRHTNIATVALANRMARTAWALLAHADTYQPDHVPVH